MQLMSLVLFCELFKDSLFYADQQRKRAQTTARFENMINQYHTLSQHDFEVNKFKADKLIKQLKKENNRSKIFVHVDMDAFYAAAETLNHPESVPMAIGSTGMLNTENYCKQFHHIVYIFYRREKVWCSCCNAWIHRFEIVSKFVRI